MFLYLMIVFFAMLIIYALNVFLGQDTFAHYEIWLAFAIIVSVIVEILIDGLCSLICEKLPNKFYKLNNKLFQISKKEQHFYEKLGIKKWKDKVWELGALGGFRKNKIVDRNNVEYLDRFIIEVCKGMVGHIVNIFAGFLVIFILPLKYWWRIGLPVAMVGAFLNLLPILILRYNLPKLQIAHKRAVRLQNVHILDQEKININ
ncbi:MAG: hypothetical protein ACI4PF_03120 [Christensenellales bacterium]